MPVPQAPALFPGPECSCTRQVFWLVTLTYRAFPFTCRRTVAWRWASVTYSCGNSSRFGRDSLFILAHAKVCFGTIVRGKCNRPWSLEPECQGRLQGHPARVEVRLEIRQDDGRPAQREILQWHSRGQIPKADLQAEVFREKECYTRIQSE